MLDRFVEGAVTRVSPEAPVPVLRATGAEDRPGGAANVAAGLCALGVPARLVGRVGRDAEGRILRRLVAALPRVRAALVPSAVAPTTLKTRFMATWRQVLRVDREDVAPARGSDEAALLRAVRALARDVNVIVVQDYGKGLVTRRVLAAVREAARRACVPVLVDPAPGRPIAEYGGGFLLLPNRTEAARALGEAALADPAGAVRRLAAAGRFRHVALKLGKDGICLGGARERARRYRSAAQEVFDVTGAGDTTLAVVAAALAAGAGVDDAVALGALGGAIAVGKPGTAVVTRAELSLAVAGSEDGGTERKIVAAEALPGILAAERRRGRRIAFTNGCFDLLHPGHVAALEAARRCADVLVVALNSDASVRALKGPGRPVLDSRARARLVAALEAVSWVTVFRGATPLPLIRRLRPDCLVKGAEWRGRVAGAEDVRSSGGEVVLTPRIRGLSTTRILEALSRIGNRRTI